MLLCSDTTCLSACVTRLHAVDVTLLTYLLPRIYYFYMLTRLHVVDAALALPRAHRARLIRHPHVHGEGARRGGECIPSLGPVGGGEYTLSRLARVRGRVKVRVRARVKVRVRFRSRVRARVTPSPDPNSLVSSRARCCAAGLMSLHQPPAAVGRTW